MVEAGGMEEPRKPRTRRRIILAVLSGIVLFAGVVFVRGMLMYSTAHGLLRFVFERKTLAKMTPEEKRQFRVWYSTRFHFEPEDLEAKPFDPETVDAAKRLLAAWEKHEAKATDLFKRYRAYVDAGDPTTGTADFDRIFQELPEVEPLVSAFTDLITRPDYEIDVLVSAADPRESFLTPIADFECFGGSVKILRLEALRLAREGQYSDAFEILETILRAAKCHEHSTLVTRLIRLYGYAIAAGTWNDVMRHCDDPPLLQKTLARQIKLAPKSDLIARNIPLDASDHVGQLRDARRFGVEVQINDKTGPELATESALAQADYLEQVVLPLVQDTPGSPALVRQAAQGYRQASGVMRGRLPNGTRLPRWLRRWLAMAIFSSGPDIEQAYTRDGIIRTRWDLLKLETARKLHRLERGSEPDTIESLVPAYLPAVPTDRFSEDDAPYRFDRVFYSVGPDRLDQKAGVLYDPTNGTVSPGDVFLPGRATLTGSRP